MMDDMIIHADDPYLQYQPAFAYTLPIQLLVSGITLTLLVVLLIHLLFTTQYHYPLAPLNYCLQLSSIITVLLGVGVRIGVILHHSADHADQWPYDLDYIAVPVPLPQWSIGEDAAWYFLQAVSNGLANLTHIQFLTLLYPSRTEARLIYFILGPLAIASSALFFTALSDSQNVIDLGDAIRNVFSSCLLLIFTISLCIWGFLVNRRRAWRLDGGTGVFGMGALGLAFVTTAVSFVAVKEEGIDWLQHLTWAAVLWQTWLGWWWWVGAGMGIGEVEDIMERAMRKRRRAARHAHRQGVINGNNANSNASNGGRRATHSMAGIVKHASHGITIGIASMMPGSHSGSGDGSGTGDAAQMRHHRARVVSPRDNDVEEDIREDIELGSLRLREPHGTRGEEGSSAGRQPPSSNSETSSTSRTPSLHPPRTAGQLIVYPAIWLQVYFRRLRRAHEEAAHKSAVEQVERRKRVPTMAGSVPTTDPDGWGLGAYGVREHAESARRVAEADRQIRTNRLLGDPDGTDSGEDGEGGDGHGHERDMDADDAEGSGSGPTVVVEDDAAIVPGLGLPGSSPAGSRSGSRPASHMGSRAGSRRATPNPSIRESVVLLDMLDEPVREPEADWVDIDDDVPSETEAGPSTGRSMRRGRRSVQGANHTPDGGGTQQQPQTPQERGQGTSWSWWGPLKDMRLQDRSTF